MKFKQEVAVILNQSNKSLLYSIGGWGGVTWSEEKIWEMHKLSPGCIYKIAHSHPDGLGNLSSRDILTLKTYAFVLYPFPIRMSVIYRDSKDSVFIKEKVYVANLEGKNSWIASKRKIRDLHIFEEYTTLIGYDEKMVIPWEEYLVKNTYE